jgi:hypothetical protein
MKDPKGEVVLLKDHEKAIKEAYDRGYHAGAQACSAMGGRTNY